MYVALNVAGADQRQDDLFSTESLYAMGRSALKGLKVQISVLDFCHSRFILIFNVRVSRTYIRSTLPILHRPWKICLGEGLKRQAILSSRPLARIKDCNGKFEARKVLEFCSDVLLEPSRCYYLHDWWCHL